MATSLNDQILDGSHSVSVAHAKAATIAVCICTYKRPELLKRLLEQLSCQEAEGRLSFSVVIADNDAECSAESVASEFARNSHLQITYCTEPQRGISATRNRAVANAAADFIAFIDDDEFPSPQWLGNLMRTLDECSADGVLGPVLEHFDEQPPAWILKGNFFQRPTYPTGTKLDWPNTRTGNVLLKAELFHGMSEPFRPKFRSGEDQDFFRRMMEKGRVFVWCHEAPVYEVVPPARWKRTYLLRRALLFGSVWAVRDHVPPFEIAKSTVAVFVYTICLPIAAILGQHRLMALLIKLCHHSGKLLSLAGINPIAETYVSN